MKKWFQKIREKIERWIDERYGGDELSLFLLMMSCALIPLARFPHWKYLSVISLIPAVFAIYRCVSVNADQREKELSVYYKLKNQTETLVSELVDRIKFHLRFRKMSCKNCGTKFIIPREAGPVETACPKCGRKIKRRL